MTVANKKRFCKIAVIAAGFIIAGFLFPWWLMPAVAFSYGFVVAPKDKSVLIFLGETFAGVAAAWSLTALAFDARTMFHLSSRLGGMFKLGFPLGGIIVVALVSGLLGATSALAGASVRICALRILDDRT